VGLFLFGYVYQEYIYFHWFVWSKMTEAETTGGRSLRKTGERLVPRDFSRASDYIQYLRHQFPYEYVVKEVRTLAPAERALEVGFGAGYGLPILAGVCSDLIGIDVEPETVAHAKSQYATDGISYQLYDGNSIPFEDNHFDFVVSFQVVEHVRDDAGFAAELHRVLNPGGRLYISTPNRETRLEPGEKPFNRYHIREYSATQLKSLLMEKFSEVAMMGVSGTEKIHRMEADRVRQGPLLRLVSRLGIRKLVPVSVDMMLAKMLSKARVESSEDFENQYSIDDFRAETVQVDQSLDLFGVCIKKEV